jgi:hypothetical protein
MDILDVGEAWLEGPDVQAASKVKELSEEKVLERRERVGAGAEGLRE